MPVEPADRGPGNRRGGMSEGISTARPVVEWTHDIRRGLVGPAAAADSTPGTIGAPTPGGIGAIGCYFVVVAALAVATVISFAVSAHGTSHLMAWALLILTVLAAIVPILIRNIARAGRRKE